MSTTGTYYFTVTRDDIIKAALKEIKYLDATESNLITQDLTDCALRFNAWLAFLATQGIWLWTFDQLVLPFAVNQNSYTIGNGGNLSTYRPLRILEGTFVRYTLNGSNFDSPLRIISRQEYDQYGNKSTPGIPNTVYYDNQMAGIAGATGVGAYDPMSAKGVLYCYPSPVDNTRTGYLQVQRPLQYVTTGSDNIDVSPEVYLMLIIGLANQIANMYETPDDLCKRIDARYKELFMQTSGWAMQEQASTYLTPNTTMYRQNRRY